MPDRSIESIIKGYVEEYVCDKCKNKQNINILPYINFNINPEYYALVKDLSVFKVKCSKCGDEKVIQFDSLLVDETHKYFIYLLSDKSVANKFKHQIKYFVETELNKDDKYDLTQYKTRLVFTLNELVEKMAIFEVGLDDKIVEIIKAGLYDKKIVDKTVHDVLLFDGMNEANLAFVSFSSKSNTVEPKKYAVSPVFYNKIVDDFKKFDHVSHDYFEVIDNEWVLSKLDK